jgi:foldase protein PrsA
VSPRSRPLRFAALAALTALALAACSSAQPPAAVVNGAKITDATLRANVPLFKFLGSLQNQPCGQADSGESAVAACSRFVLTNLIEEQIVLPYAHSHHLSVQPSDVDQTISNIEQSVGQSKVKSLLGAQGLTASDLKTLITRLLLIQRVGQEVAKANTSDAQLRQLYEQNTLQFTQLHAKHILVKTQALAEKIAKEATPANFGELATKYSIDTGSAQNGGDLGTVPAAQFDQDFVSAALKLSPGEISGPVHTQFGWHVIELISVKVTPFEQAKAQLLARQGTSVFVSWLHGRLGSAAIEVNPRYGRFDPTTGTVIPVTSTATGLPSPTGPTGPPAATP